MIKEKRLVTAAAVFYTGLKNVRQDEEQQDGRMLIHGCEGRNQNRQDHSLALHENQRRRWRRTLAGRQIHDHTHQHRGDRSHQGRRG